MMAWPGMSSDGKAVAVAAAEEGARSQLACAAE